MAIQTHLLQVPLRSLGFSHECLHWLQASGCRTIEDAEDRITILLNSEYYKRELLKEMIHVITLFLASESVKAQNERKSYLLSLRKKKKAYWWRWLSYWFACVCRYLSSPSKSQQL
jgi:hypothetical protein